MKVNYAGIKRKYYKYQYNDFVQPVLTSNGVIGGASFAVSAAGSWEASSPAFLAFDGQSTHCIFQKGTNYYIQFYNPNPLNVTKLDITNWGGDAWGTRALTAGSIQVSNDGEKFIELSTYSNSVTGGNVSWSIDLSSNAEYYKYYRIITTGTSYANNGAASQCMLTELKITAQEQTVIEGSESDYDFYEDVDVYNLPTKTVRTYYKYIDWTQPVLTSNTSSSVLIVSATNEGQGAAYGAFNGNTSTGWATANNVTTGTLTALLDKDIYITSIEIVGLSNQYGSTNTIVIYSDTNKQTIIGEQKSFNYSVSNTLVWTFEKPIKANTLVFYGTGTTWVSIREITITAQKQVIVEKPQDDYDFYEDVDIYSLPTIQVPIYEKYDYEYLNTLPTYASATAGEAGINGISFTPADMYFCVAKSQNGTIKDYASYPVTWSFGDREFKMDSYSYTGWGANMSHHGAGLTSITASNDGINWETITLPDTQYRKYYRFNWYAPEAGKWGKMGMNYFNFKGMLREKVVSTNGEPLEIITQYQGIIC